MGDPRPHGLVLRTLRLPSTGPSSVVATLLDHRRAPAPEPYQTSVSQPGLSLPCCPPFSALGFSDATCMHVGKTHHRKTVSVWHQRGAVLSCLRVDSGRWHLVLVLSGGVGCSLCAHLYCVFYLIYLKLPCHLPLVMHLTCSCENPFVVLPFLNPTPCMLVQTGVLTG